MEELGGDITFGVLYLAQLAFEIDGSLLGEGPFCVPSHYL